MARVDDLLEAVEGWANWVPVFYIVRPSGEELLCTCKLCSTEMAFGPSYSTSDVTGSLELHLFERHEDVSPH